MFKIPNNSCPQLNSKTNGLGLLFSTGNGWKLKKLGQPFKVLMLSQQKYQKTILCCSFFKKKKIQIFTYVKPLSNVLGKN